MAPLSLSQIESIVNQARASGFSKPEADALRQSLIDRAADMNGATRLEMSMQLLPDDEAAPMRDFLADFATIRSGVLKRGAAELDSLTDDEWARLIAPEGDGNGTQA